MPLLMEIRHADFIVEISVLIVYLAYKKVYLLERRKTYVSNGVSQWTSQKVQGVMRHLKQTS